MKLTVIESEAKKTGCKHEVGKVYLSSGTYYLLVESMGIYKFIHLIRNFICIGESKSLEEVDERYSDDVEVDSELIIREVK